MTWTVLERQPKSIIYNDGNKRAIASSIATLNYASTVDEAIDSPIDMTLQAVSDHPLLTDGWIITAAPWLYALGQRPGMSDGWVGFGARTPSGIRRLWFRLLQIGYYHHPTGDWDNIGNTPTYNRANLSNQTGSIELPTGDSINISSIATWDDIFTTPSGGAVSISWQADGDRVKELITLNQAGRTWIQTNHPPSTPTNETYFGFVFRFDIAEIPRWYLNDVLSDPDNGIDDNETGQIYLRDSTDRLLALLPVSYCYVPADYGAGDSDEHIPIRKRIYKSGDNYYLVIGVRVDRLLTLPAGNLIFDPTIDIGVSASLDDGMDNSGAMNPTAVSGNADATDKYHAMIFRGITISAGSTIDTAYISVEVYNANLDEPKHTITGEESAAPDDYTPGNDLPNARTKTTANVLWDSADLGGAGWYDTPSIISIIEELQTSYGPYSNGAMSFFMQGDADTNRDLGIYFYDQGAANAPQIYIEYTAAGGRSTYNTDSNPLGLHTAMSWRLT